ncbi:histidine kinase [Micromonospora sp. NPDC049559]|uniref:sensor histidine kinase n=1 Tax=Micromonospora sp. NPDC049559 TaxID=3155923 RepID=UPI00341B0587
MTTGEIVIQVSWRRYVRSGIGLAVLVAAVAQDAPWSGSRGLGAAVALVAIVSGWLAWTIFPGRPRRVLAGTATTGLAGIGLVLTGTAPATWTLAPIAALAAGRRLRPAVSAGLATGFAVLLVALGLPAGVPPPALGAGVAALAVALLLGVALRQADELREKTRLGREERARAEELAERSRLAREVHDVLAHSLGALTVQLETADALLEAGRYGPARTSVVRAGELARDGLAETRRAIGALRGDPVPWREMIDELAGGYEGEARVVVEPEPPELPAEVSLALYRAAQEAITNVRRHAPGAPVEIRVGATPREVTLSVRNGPSPAREPGPLAGTGGGYGLVGLRERAELAGGSFSAGPSGEGWQLQLRVPR